MKRTNSTPLALVGLLVFFGFPAFASSHVNDENRTNKLLEPPGATYTFAFGLNNLNCVVGSFVDSSGVYEGFEYCNGKYQSIVYPGSFGGTQANGLNDSNLVVGDFVGQDGLTHGFLLQNDAFTQYDIRAATAGLSTYVMGVNRTGNFTGYVGTGATGYEGYVNIGADVTEFTVNNSLTYPIGINNSDDVVGFFIPPPLIQFHGFYRSANGAIQQIDYPGAQSTACLGMNDSGIITGYYVDSHQVQHGFAYQHGRFVTIDAPTVVGVNHEGSFVGYYTTPNQVTYGYLSKPSK